MDAIREHVDGRTWILPHRHKPHTMDHRASSRHHRIRHQPMARTSFRNPSCKIPKQTRHCNGGAPNRRSSGKRYKPRNHRFLTRRNHLRTPIRRIRVAVRCSRRRNSDARNRNPRSTALQNSRRRSHRHHETARILPISIHTRQEHQSPRTRHTRRMQRCRSHRIPRIRRPIHARIPRNVRLHHRHSRLTPNPRGHRVNTHHGLDLRPHRTKTRNRRCYGNYGSPSLPIPIRSRRTSFHHSSCNTRTLLLLRYAHNHRRRNGPSRRRYRRIRHRNDVHRRRCHRRTFANRRRRTIRRHWLVSSSHLLRSNSNRRNSNGTTNPNAKKQTANLGPLHPAYPCELTHLRASTRGCNNPMSWPRPGPAAPP